MINIKEDDVIVFKYKNYRGETSLRKAIVINVLYGSTEYHAEEQILIQAWDMDKEQMRIYAAKDIVDLAVRR